MKNEKQRNDNTTKFSRFGAYYAFILEFLANIGTGFPTYNLTDKELDIIKEKDTNKYSFREKFLLWLLFVSWVLLIPCEVYIWNKYNIDDKLMGFVYGIVTLVYGILSIRLTKTKGKL